MVTVRHMGPPSTGAFMLRIFWQAKGEKPMERNCDTLAGIVGLAQGYIGSPKVERVEAYMRLGTWRDGNYGQEQQTHQ